MTSLIRMALPLIGVVGLTTTTLAQSTTKESPPQKPASTASAPATTSKIALPPAIDAAFKKSYPNATIKHVSKEKEGGKEVYEVESLDNGMARDLIYRPDGSVVEYEEQISESDVPAAVVTAIKTRYPKATFGKCEKLYKDGTTNYEIALKGAAGKAVVLTPDGKWVSPKK